MYENPKRTIMNIGNETTPARDRTEIQIETSDLDIGLNSLSEIVSHIESRLLAVTRPETTKQSDQVRPMPDERHTPLGAALALANDRLRSNILRIESFLSRLEV